MIALLLGKRDDSEPRRGSLCPFCHGRTAVFVLYHLGREHLACNLCILDPKIEDAKMPGRLLFGPLDVPAGGTARFEKQAHFSPAPNELVVADTTAYFFVIDRIAFDDLDVLAGGGVPAAVFGHGPPMLMPYGALRYMLTIRNVDAEPHRFAAALVCGERFGR
jgi:hypothetical protein